jgi:hypothetical protein
MSSAAAPTERPMIDFARCFQFVTDDPDWIKKVLIGGAFMLASMFIVGIFFVSGYWARFLKQVAAGQATPLPEWEDLGGIFGDGLKIVGVYFVHLLGVVSVVAALGCAAGLITAGVAGIAPGSDEAGSAAAAVGGLGFAAFYGLFLILGLALGVYMPAVFVRVALRDSFAEGFAWRENAAFIRQNLGNYALSLVLGLLTNFISQFGIVLCCVGIFPLAFWGYLVVGYALGETVRLNPRSV